MFKFKFLFNDLSKVLLHDLIRYKKNIYSQNGEDGIKPSNTFSLVTQKWNAVYIEADKTIYTNLLNIASKYKNIFPINATVSEKKIPHSLWMHY